MKNWTSWSNSALKQWWKSCFGTRKPGIIHRLDLSLIYSREKPQVILIQQVGTFALTLIITCLSSLYDDESIQIGTGQRLLLVNDLSFFVHLDPPHNANYVSIFTRKSDLTKSNVSIIEHSNHWKMLHVQVRSRNTFGNVLMKSWFAGFRLSTRMLPISIYSTLLSMTMHHRKRSLHSVSKASIRWKWIIPFCVGSAAKCVSFSNVRTRLTCVAFRSTIACGIHVHRRWKTYGKRLENVQKPRSHSIQPWIRASKETNQQLATIDYFFAHRRRRIMCLSPCIWNLKGFNTSKSSLDFSLQLTGLFKVTFMYRIKSLFFFNFLSLK